MSKASRETAMIHFQCGTCGMAATIVDTPTGVLAWHDHMAIHAAPDNYRMWTWSAVELPLS